MGVLSPCLEINGKALKANLAKVRKQVGRAKVMAVVKANAYGHGALDVCQYLSADSFAVARVSEALVIRDAFPEKDIVVMQGVFNEDELRLAAQYQLQIVVHHAHQIELLEQSELSAAVVVWFKIDTGMHRLGFLPEDVPSSWARLDACAQVAQPIHIMTHFACADEPQHDLSGRQMQLFSQICPETKGFIALANSGGVLNFPKSYASCVRTGLVLYGVSPSSAGRPADFCFQPVMTLKAYLVAVRSHPRGEPVGYGATWISSRDTRLGVVSIGYADGYPRNVPSGTPVMIGDRYVPIVGRVSMDMMSVDLGPDGQEQVGDEVILWGEGLPIEDIALAADTIPYELMTKITSRVTKYFKT